MWSHAALRLEHYEEALQNPASGLTLPVLTGARKQSVVDAECLFSLHMAKFMPSKAYEFKAKYIKVLWNWRRACDHGGLMELHHCHYNFHLVLRESFMNG